MSNEIKVQPAASDGKKEKSLKSFNKKKRKKIIKTVIMILIIAAVLVFAVYKAGLLDKFIGKEDAEANKLTTYTLTENTAYRTITKVLTSTGTIEPNDQYTITALVSGEILADHFNKGDTVIEDQLLYEIESDSLDSNVTKSRNALKTNQTALDNAYEKLEKLNVDTDVSGIIQKIHVEIGDEITAGTLVAEITDTENLELELPFLDTEASDFTIGSGATVSFPDSPETISGTVSEISAVTNVNAIGAITRKVTISVKNTGSITPNTVALAKVGDAVSTSSGNFKYSDEGNVYAEIGGEVTAIYYNEGDKVQKGAIIVKLYSEELENQIETLEINVENAQTGLDDALDAYDNYNITSPISGTVISKEYKAGDTIGGVGNGNAQLAVIYDMSALKFTMSIDELDIDSLEEGQQVIITSDSREGSMYYGIITNISIQGTTTNGTTVYPVEVTINNEEDESQRKVLEDGTVNKVYKTGMTSVVSVYKLSSTSHSDGAEVYTYEDGTVIKKVNYDGGYSLYCGDEKLNSYAEDSYMLSSTVYSFDRSFNEMTVEVRNEKKMLRPGMNIDAQVIVEKRENVLAVPVDAIGRGNIVKVLKNPDKSDSAETSKKDNPTKNVEPSENKEETFTPDEKPQMGNTAKGNVPNGTPGNSTENRIKPNNAPTASGRGENAYGTADIDSEYEEVRVTVGISDDEYIEITSGLEIGDVIIIESAERTSQNQMFGMMGMGGGMPAGGMYGGGMPAGGMGGGRQMGGGGMPR